ncbi:MAG: glycerol-3-phosphate dehydrogenase [Alphaproteobacteria bacterium]|nr:glycerol-3-phosphate dehydrogenase [Alphaproteobacteria bacterium]
MAKMKTVDVLVIGGGINGVGIARDLSGRGVSVILCEKDDLASATSSASTKLLQGGLCHLKRGKIRLMREAMTERDILLRSAPHIIWPMTFVLPHYKRLCPWWLIRMVLSVYDYLGWRTVLPKSKWLSFVGTRIGQPLKLLFKRGFSYSDCVVDDARLVVLNAMDAYEKGAKILTRTECIGLDRHPKEPGWAVTLLDNITEDRFMVHAQVVVNASGPWVNKVLSLVDEGAEKYGVRWIKGSHILVPRIYQGEYAYVLKNDDGRDVFAIPYEEKHTLIGTTESDYDGDIEEVRVDLDEVEYLCGAVNRYFRHQIKPEDVEWTYSGVSPMIDGSECDYILDAEEHHGARILSVYGGKITTYRKLSEQSGDRVVEMLGRGRGAWTEPAALPGGEGSAVNFETFLKTLRREYGWIPEALILRYARSYGARARAFLRGFKRLSDMGEYLGDDVYEAEISYLVNVEWALTMDDLLWRRSKLGLHISDDTRKNIQKLLKNILTKKGN